ncbi:MAG: SDR family oxidoreductase [Burkholderiaceae bacterium]
MAASSDDLTTHDSATETAPPQGRGKAALGQRPVALITGGGRGIGAATAVLAAQRGYDLVLAYRSDAGAAEAVAERAREQGAHAVCVPADVADEASVLALFATLDAEVGRLDALVNNAGVLDRSQPFLDYTAERMQRIFQTNVFGAFIVAREAARRMARSRGGAGGAIVNVSSAASRMGSPGEYVDYAASKGAMDSMTLGLAKELAGEGIRVNAVRPGLIHTDIHASGGRPGRVGELAHQVPLARGGTAEEVANAIVWLLSGEASYVTGALLDVGGGR